MFTTPLILKPELLCKYKLKLNLFTSMPGEKHSFTSSSLLICACMCMVSTYRVCDYVHTHVHVHECPRMWKPKVYIKWLFLIIIYLFIF